VLTAGCTLSLMETRLALPFSPSTRDAAASPAEELPGLYRAILDRVAVLELVGERVEAGRIRMSATGIYSSAWDEAGRTRLVSILARADRVLNDQEHPRGWSMRRRPAQAR
jgi:hypothetical protein